MTTRRGRLVLGALGTAAAALIVAELAFGALHYGETRLADPCTAKPAFTGGGVDGAIQRFALSGLNGAACRLHTSREELVLSFTPAAGTRIRWSSATISAALKAGLDRAAKDTAGGGVLGSLASLLFRDLLADPLAWLLGHAG
jgi:hypothetical protein